MPKIYNFFILTCWPLVSYQLKIAKEGWTFWAVLRCNNSTIFLIFIWYLSVTHQLYYSSDSSQSYTESVCVGESKNISCGTSLSVLKIVNATIFNATTGLEWVSYFILVLPPSHIVAGVFFYWNYYCIVSSCIVLSLPVPSYILVIMFKIIVRVKYLCVLIPDSLIIPANSDISIDKIKTFRVYNIILNNS